MKVSTTSSITLWVRRSHEVAVPWICRQNGDSEAMWNPQADLTFGQ